MTVPKLITRQLLFSNILGYHILLLQDTDIVGFFSSTLVKDNLI